MLKIFVLEDEIDRYPRNQIREALIGHEVTFAKSCPEAKQKFVGPYDLLLLDHDMEGNYEYRPNYPNTGFQFVKWLVEQGPTPKPDVIIHSWNNVGAKNMQSLLEDHDFKVQYVPFGPEYVRALKEQLKPC